MSEPNPISTQPPLSAAAAVSSPRAASPDPPQAIGRYRIQTVLGEGGFGRVYLAHDEQLQRPVAVKVPHPKLVSRPQDAQAYLTEARTVAGLDHPNIVPVYDVGSTDDCPVFVVSKYIEGSTLTQRLRQDRPSVAEAVALVATVAETLHYAHRQGLVHRDIKPGNILLDAAGKPHVADFGLALRERDVGKGPRFAGTPAYMSPEQARGEGHRVDGRSDLFSLGVVFYELLTGRRPFRADSREELLEQITDLEVRPPRQWDDTIPKELERICLKALSKRASERYTTARDLADDLRHFLEQSTDEDKLALRSRVGAGAAPSAASTATPVLSPPPLASDSQPIKIVPKGLRSFDAQDADFFLELLPGPRDRDGLPDSIRFWKTRLEETDADRTFPVGLIYGPSGCGKSSLVKAGLLPRLAKAIPAVYVEATGQETEARLLKGLRRQLPDLPGDLGLIDTVAALRRGWFLEPGQKVVLVLDQFEQWLHAKRSEDSTELVQALRQCDGGRVQGLVLVRDDFWLAVSRFMKATEVEILEGRNSALVDLFDLLHARKVLAAFGRAYGRLPDNLGQCSKDQDAFLDQAVAGLAQEGKVISVRLALFAEMVKGKLWTPATLKAVGGTAGVGITFLEETFAAATAPPQHRLHQKAAQAVLKALLPETGTDLKGHMRSHAELLAASSYTHRPKDFDDLLRILDGELRLLTPTDQEGKEDAAPSAVPAGTQYYQLTHDYLVPSLRDWLTRKQKETRRGRAALLLADRAAVWNARPENRQLPSLLQWCQIKWLTAKKTWTLPQRQLMRQATRYHGLRGLVVSVLLVLAGWGVYEGHGRLQANALRRGLLDANINEVPAIVQDMAPYRRWLDPLLHDAYTQAERDNDRRKQLHASLALLPVDATQVDYLYGRLLAAEPHEVPVIRHALAPHRAELVGRLWTVVEKPETGKESHRLRAAAALAMYDPDSAKWAPCSPVLAQDLVRENPVFLGQWSEAYRPVKQALLAPLAALFRDPRPEQAAERTLATNLLADYAADQPQLLAELLLDADAKQFAVIYPKLKERGEQGLPLLTAEINKKLPPDLPSSDAKREQLAKRQANAAVALLRMKQPEQVWPLLKHRPDPRARSYLIHRLSPLGAEAGALLQRLDEEPDPTIRRALLLSLGEFGDKELPPDTRNAWLPKVQALYRSEADPGLHAAAEWLLRQWKQEAWLKQTNDGWAKDKEQRAQRLHDIQQLLTKAKEKAPPQWYVNGQGHTMVVIPGPVKFQMGSPWWEADREGGPWGPLEAQHRKRIGRSFAMAAKEVTVEQFLRFRPYHAYAKQYSPTSHCPVNDVSWYEATAYCNWLSQQEGIRKDQWCYLPAAGDNYEEGMRLAPDYLRRTGYRLPSEAEWEYACRAGALGSRYYGDTEDLLGKYAWYTKNSLDRCMLPGGSLKPNDLGLFDMLGNALEWCQEGMAYYRAGEDVEDTEDIKDRNSRVLRGGAFINQARNVRSAYRFRNVPTIRNNVVGFRPARTFTP